MNYFISKIDLVFINQINILCVNVCFIDFNNIIFCVINGLDDFINFYMNFKLLINYSNIENIFNFMVKGLY